MSKCQIVLIIQRKCHNVSLKKKSMGVLEDKVLYENFIKTFCKVFLYKDQCYVKIQH